VAGKTKPVRGFRVFQWLVDVRGGGGEAGKVGGCRTLPSSSVGIGRERFEYRAAKASIMRSTICKANCSATGKDK